MISSATSVGRRGITPTIRHELRRRGALVAILLGFQYEHEARAFLQDLQVRLRKFELALHPKKTRLIRFGCHAAEQRKRLGRGKPESANPSAARRRAG